MEGERNFHDLVYNSDAHLNSSFSHLALGRRSLQEFRAIAGIALRELWISSTRLC